MPPFPVALALVPGTAVFEPATQLTLDYRAHRTWDQVGHSSSSNDASQKQKGGLCVRARVCACGPARGKYSPRLNGPDAEPNSKNTRRLFVPLVTHEFVDRFNDATTKHLQIANVNTDG